MPLHQQCTVFNFPSYSFWNRLFSVQAQGLSLAYCFRVPMVHASIMCGNIFSHAEGRGWLLYWLMTHSLFQPAGGTSIMQVISSCMPAAKRLPFPHIRVIFLLIETHSAATAFSQGGKWQVKISRHLSPLPSPSVGKSGCEVDKFL